jgi:hypothetical protein
MNSISWHILYGLIVLDLGFLLGALWAASRELEVKNSDESSEHSSDAL